MEPIELLEPGMTIEAQSGPRRVKIIVAKVLEDLVTEDDLTFNRNDRTFVAQDGEGRWLLCRSYDGHDGTAARSLAWLFATKQELAAFLWDDPHQEGAAGVNLQLLRRLDLLQLVGG